MINREKFKVYKNVFSESTLRSIFKLSCQNHFKELKSPVSIGKEANIFSAYAKDKKVIIKIYRIESCDFNRMFDYIKSDSRYFNLRKKRRTIVFAWAQRESRNLIKARQAGVRVPLAIACLNNILVLEFVGDKEPAPKLKDKIPKNKKLFFDKIINNVKKLHKAGLVHGDLSQFNILNYNEEPVLIDFSQCTTINNPCAMGLLKRDIKNICSFFNKIGLKVDERKVKENFKNTS